MPNQTSGNVLAAIKREATLGAAPGSTGAQQFRTVDSPGLDHQRGTIESNERRRDLLKTMGRLGSKSNTGSYNTELTVGGVTDLLIESILRGTWTPPVMITEIAMTSITTTASTIVAAGGSWITQGVRVGDVVTLTNHATVGNNGLRLRVTGVTATTITVAGNPLTVNAVADAAFTLTVMKKVIAPGSPLFHSYSIEEHDLDIDESQLFLGNRLSQLTLTMRPNAMTTCAWSFLGLNRDIMDEAATPYFVNPSLTTGLPLVADDSWIRYRGEDVAVVTGLDLTFTIATSLTPVVGSLVSPDVFVNDLTVSGSVTGIRTDLDNLRDFDAETEFEVHTLLVEPTDDPKPSVGLFLPRTKIGAITAPFSGGEGPKIETRTLMTGVKNAEAGYDSTVAAFYSSGA